MMNMFGKLPNKWETKRFMSPGMPHSPVHFWVWNGKCSHEETDRQLDEMFRLGVRAFYIVPEPKDFRPNSMPTDLEPDYLTDEYFEEYLYAMRQAKRLGMQCWLYDEGGWPSGGACGKVIEQYPETKQKCLRCAGLTFKKGEIYQKKHPDALVAFTSNGEYIKEGFCFLRDASVTEYYSTVEPGINYPDITKKDTTNHFLQITHEAYKKAFGDEFEKLISAVFTDEPKAPYMSPDNFPLFEEVYGYSILPFVPVLMPELNPSLAAKLLVTKEAKKVLADWYDLNSHLFCDNYLLACKKWSNDHNLLFTGHMDVDHTHNGCVNGGLNFHLMRALRCLDIPGVDVIWRQIFPGEKRKTASGDIIAENGFFPRYASSAAAQNGSGYALTESLGVYGNGVTFEEMRFCFGFQAIRGINIFNPALISYSRSGYALTQEQPSFAETFALYKCMDKFNAYLERLSYVCSLGERVCDTALYCPVNDFWRRENANAISDAFDEAGRILEDRRIDFDIVDDDVIEKAGSIENGCICMGKARYTTIVIPKNAYIPDRIKTRLEQFCAAGGKILYNAGELSGFALGGNADKVRMMHRILENGELFCFFNENANIADFCLPVSCKYAYRVSVDEGKLYSCPQTDNGVRLKLASGETGAILITQEFLAASEELPDCENSLTLYEFDFIKKTACILKESGCKCSDIESASQRVNLGDWSCVAGELSLNCTGRLFMSLRMACQFLSLMSLARYIFRIMAGMTWLFSKWKL
ncbi:MAG: hypothetical protein IKI68_05300, partial [Clostridia bacterium]|nr:hypothetical protein [Clostridia bacterium]